MVTTNELTQRYIREHRSIRDCLAKGLINYSALARRISKEIGTSKKTTDEAILIAARRFSEQLRPERAREDRLRKMLKQSELEIKNRVITVILEKGIYKDHFREFRQKVESKADLFHSVEGSKTITVVTTEKYLHSIKSIFDRNIMKVNEGLVEIVIKSPPEIESTPGVVSDIVHLFGENDVNMYEFMSCWTDTIIVISEKDLGKALAFLRL